jgi:hypothetical protein
MDIVTFVSGVAEDPRLYGTAIGLILLVAGLVWRYRNPEQYKWVKNQILKIWSTAYQVVCFVGAVVSLFGIIGVYFYTDPAFPVAYPRIYAVVNDNISTVIIVFLIYNFIFFVFQKFLHHWGSLDNGIIDDPDQRRKNDELENRINYQSVNMEANVNSINSLRGDIVEVKNNMEAMRQWFLKHGNRIEENGAPEEGERRTNPYYVPTDDGVKLVEPSKTIDQYEPPIIPVQQEEMTRDEDTPKRDKDYDGSKIDKFVLGGIKRILNKE